MQFTETGRPQIYCGLNTEPQPRYVIWSSPGGYYRLIFPDEETEAGEN